MCVVPQAVVEASFACPPNHHNGDDDDDDDTTTTTYIERRIL